MSQEIVDINKLEASAEQLSYAVPGNDKGGRLMVYGNKNAPHVLFFCAGFPDNANAFMPLASKLAADKDCLCGVACFPGYDVHHENWKPEGYTFDEVAVSLREATKVLKGVSTNPDSKWVGVFHDWGCAAGSMLTNRLNEDLPGFFSKIVYFDILPPTHKSHNVPKEEGLTKRQLVSFSYMSVCSACFSLQRFVSYYLAAPTFTFGFIVLGMLGLTPTRQIDNDTFQTHTPKYSLRKLLYMCYPYYYMFRSLKELGNEVHLPASLEKTPVLYMYGLDKNIMFHDPNHLEWLEKEAKKEGSKSKVVSVDKAGHWLYLQQPAICYEEAKNFVFDS